MRFAKGQEFTGDLATQPRYATRGESEIACVTIVSTRNDKRKAKGAPMRSEAQDPYHISGPLKETTNRLQKEIDEIQAGEGEELARVPPERVRAAWSVSKRLARRFGFGTDPKRREHFYEQLERLVDEHGNRVLAIISDCVWAAEKARSKDRYFCKAVKARLEENGFEVNETNNDW